MPKIADSHQMLERGKKELSSRAFSESMHSPVTFQTSRLQNHGGRNFCCLKPSHLLNREMNIDSDVIGIGELIL